MSKKVLSVAVGSCPHAPLYLGLSDDRDDGKAP